MKHSQLTKRIPALTAACTAFLIASSIAAPTLAAPPAPTTSPAARTAPATNGGGAFTGRLRIRNETRVVHTGADSFRRAGTFTAQVAVVTNVSRAPLYFTEYQNGLSGADFVIPSILDWSIWREGKWVHENGISGGCGVGLKERQVAPGETVVIFLSGTPAADKSAERHQARMLFYDVRMNLRTHSLDAGTLSHECLGEARY